MINRKRIVSQLYRAWRSEPFVWGKSDCLYWAAACAEAITGHDPAAALKERYSGQVSAARVFKEEGWNNVGDLAATLLPEIPVAQSRSGDWAHVEDDQGTDGLGVVCGHLIAARTENGMGRIPLSYAKRVFRVE